MNAIVSCNNGRNVPFFAVFDIGMVGLRRRHHQRNHLIIVTNSPACRSWWRRLHAVDGFDCCQLFCWRWTRFLQTRPGLIGAADRSRFFFFMEASLHPFAPLHVRCMRDYFQCMRNRHTFACSHSAGGPSSSQHRIPCGLPSPNSKARVDSSHHDLPDVVEASIEIVIPSDCPPKHPCTLRGAVRCDGHIPLGKTRDKDPLWTGPISVTSAVS